MTERTENNALISRLYYEALTDAAGYPNGMAYWHELKPEHKYHEGSTGIYFLEMMEKAGFITINKPIGFEGGWWNQGECKALLEWFREHQADEEKKFEDRLAALRAMLPKNNAG